MERSPLIITTKTQTMSTATSASKDGVGYVSRVQISGYRLAI